MIDDGSDSARRNPTAAPAGIGQEPLGLHGSGAPEILIERRRTIDAGVPMDLEGGRERAQRERQGDQRKILTGRELVAVLLELEDRPRYELVVERVVTRASPSHFRRDRFLMTRTLKETRRHTVADGAVEMADRVAGRRLHSGSRMLPNDRRRGSNTGCHHTGHPCHHYGVGAEGDPPRGRR
jgi:hypothetical protein